MHVLFCLQCSSAGLVGAAALVQRKLAVPEDARGCQGPGAWWAHLGAPFFHSCPAELRLQSRTPAGWLLLTCPLQENILYFSWTGTPSALVLFFPPSYS